MDIEKDIENKIHKLIYDLKTHTEKGEKEEAEKNLTELSKLWDDYHEFFSEHVKSEFSDFKENIKKNIDPVLSLSHKISELENRVNENFKNDAKTQRSVKDSSEFINKNRESLEFISNIVGNFKILLGISVITSIGIFLSLWIYAKHLVESEVKVIEKKVEEKTRDLDDVINQNLETSVLVRNATQVVSESVESRYMLGYRHRSIAYINDALYKLDRILADREFKHFNSFRIDETITYIYAYRDRLDRFSDYGEANPAKCDATEFSYANIKTASALSDWASGFIPEAFKSLNTAWQHCEIPENRFLFYWMYMATDANTRNDRRIEGIFKKGLDLSDATIYYKQNFLGKKGKKKLVAPPPVWIQLLSAVRLFELQLFTKSSPPANNEALQIQYNKHKNELNLIKFHLGLDKDESYRDLFERIHLNTANSHRVVSIAAHYAQYLNWAAKRDNKNTDTNRKYVIDLINNLANWPDFLKVQNNLIDRFHPCMLRSNDPSNESYKNHCANTNRPVEYSAEAPYFGPIEDIHLWLEYLNNFYHHFRHDQNFTINDSLLKAYRKVINYNKALNGDNLLPSQTEKEVMYAFKSLNLKLCNSPQFQHNLNDLSDNRRLSALENIENATKLILNQEGVSACSGPLTEGCKERIDNACALLSTYHASEEYKSLQQKGLISSIADAPT